MGKKARIRGNGGAWVELHGVITPRLARFAPTLAGRITDLIDDYAEQRGENPHMIDGQLWQYIQFSRNVAASEGLDFPLLALTDDADTIFAKFEQFSDTSHFDLVQLANGDAVRTFETPEAPETAPVAEGETAPNA